MTIAAKRVRFEDYANDLSGLLEVVARQQGPVELEFKGQVFRLEKTEDRPYDPEETRKALRKAAGILKGVDTVRLKRDLRAMR
jgi:hypothetical protein